jgi:hypothetical protein
MNNALVEKGKELKQRGMIVCGSSVVIFAPVLRIISRSGTPRAVIFVLIACWVFDLVLGIWFIVRGTKLMQQGSESNG